MQDPYANDENPSLPDQIPQTPQSPQSPQSPSQGSYSPLYEHYGQFGQMPPPSMPPSRQPYQPQQAYQPSHQPVPGQFQSSPAMSTPTTRYSRRLRTGAILALTLLLAVVFGVGLFAGWQFGRTSTVSNFTSPSSSNNTTSFQQGNNPAVTIPPLTGNNIEAVREAVVAKVRPAVVQVNVTLQSSRAIGSGVIIDARGYIVTNNHVVNGAQALEVELFDGTRLPAQLVGTDPADDLAVIKVTPPKNGLTTIKIGDSSKLQVGEDVLAIGNPLGNTETVTSGIVSALGRNVSEGQNGATLPDAIQTDAPINPGNSGGALVDLQANLIGIPTLTAIDPEFNTPANGVGFAIPSNRVSFIAQQLIATGQVTHTGRAVLGVEVADVDATVAAQDNLSVDHGALIISLTPGYPAASAGLHAGDVIVQIDSTPVNDTASLGDALVNKNPGDTVAVHIYRGSQQLTINVQLGELQAG